MRRLSFIAVATCTLALVFAACGDKKFKGYKKTDSGLYYKITTKNDKGKTPKEGDYLSMIVSFDADFDSTLVFPSREIQDLLSPSAFKGDIFEAYSLLKEGEEGEFYIKADSFCIYFMGGLPPTVKPEDLLHFKIQLKEIKTAEEMAIKQQEYLKEKAEEEMSILEKYLEEQKITEKPTASGMYFIEKVKGKGAKAENGKNVEVHYTGRLLDGRIFDSSEGKDPHSFQLGAGQVIKGWDEGIALMREGGKATLIIPSALAYGDGNGMLPPYATLVFDVELVKVSNAKANNVKIETTTID